MRQSPEPVPRPGNAPTEGPLRERPWRFRTALARRLLLIWWCLLAAYGINLALAFTGWPLEEAVMRGHWPLFLCALVVDARGVRGEEGAFALGEACSDGRTGMARMLVDSGASPDGGWDWVPLCCAAEGGHVGTVRMLLLRGADPSREDDLRRTPLHRAATSGSRDCASLLLDWGAPINAVDCDGCTPLTLAESHGNTAVASLLRSRGGQLGGRERSHR